MNDIDLNPDLTKFSREVSKFEDEELRSIFYDLAVEKGSDPDYRRHPIEKEFGRNFIAPFQIILLGWNTRAYLGMGISREKFENDIVSFLESHQNELLELQTTNLLDIDFFSGDQRTQHGQMVIDLFNRLIGDGDNGGINRINSTGASKLLHFVNRDLFVMWDGYISGKTRVEDDSGNKVRIGYHQEGRDRHFNQHTSGDGRCYLTFLDEMQTLAENLIKQAGTREEVKVLGAGKTLPKLLDQYNYQTITSPHN